MTHLKQNPQSSNSVFNYLTPPVSLTITILLTLAYGAFAVVLFDGRTIDRIPLESFSWSFVMLVPYGIGILMVGSEFLLRRFRFIKKDAEIGEDFKQITFVEAVFVPWLGLVIVVVFSLLITLGFLLCFIISVPIIFPAASLGGITVWMLQRHRKAALTIILLAVFAPFGLSTVEAQFEKERKTVQTLTSIHIEADAAAVWQEIGRVAPITPEEHHFNWTHYVGIPRPVEATLGELGLGGMREGHFENGLRFEEEIVEWEELRRMGFKITEASDSLLPKPLDVIDGETFDIVAGMYEIEELADGTVMLHFSSEHFLSTRFNDYGAFWTDLLMRNLQDYILEIVKARAEAV